MSVDAPVTAPDPGTWLATDLEAHFAYHDEEHRPEPGERRVLTTADLLADDAAELRGAHARLRADRTSPQAAATYLTGWFAGNAATVVGVGLATARAGFLLDAGSVRWQVGPEGWPERTWLVQPRVVVPPGHRWAGQPGVEPVAGLDVVAQRAVHSAIAFAEPLVAACRGLARVGLSKLWDEFADGLGCVLSHRLEPAVTQEMLDVLASALRVPGVPWRSRARLVLVDDPVLGSVHLAQKGGCCLAFTCPPEPTAPLEELDAEERLWRQRFPPPGDRDKRYCSTCTHRTAEDCDARQLFWLQRHHARRHAAR